MLRNPSDQAQPITLDVGHVLELPVGAERRFSAKSPWKDDAGHSEATPPGTSPVSIPAAAASPAVITLELKPIH